MAAMSVSDLIDMSRLEASAARAAGLLKAMSNERRLMILCRLGDEECQVGALQTAVGLSQSALSQHLALLREDGLVVARRQGVTMHYVVADPAVERVIALLAELYCPPET